MGDEFDNEVKTNGNRGDSVDQPILSNEKEMTLLVVLHRMMKAILLADRVDPNQTWFPVGRITNSVTQNSSHLFEAYTLTGRKFLVWTRRGRHLRALLIAAVGTISLVAMTELLIYVLSFFTLNFINAIEVSLVISLIAAGGFLSVCVGEVSDIEFAIFTATLLATMVVLIVSEWMDLFAFLRTVLSKGFGFAKTSLSVRLSAISAYFGWHAQSRREIENDLDGSELEKKCI